MDVPSIHSTVATTFVDELSILANLVDELPSRHRYYAEDHHLCRDRADFRNPTSMLCEARQELTRIAAVSREHSEHDERFHASLESVRSHKSAKCRDASRLHGMIIMTRPSSSKMGILPLR